MREDAPAAPAADRVAGVDDAYDAEPTRSLIDDLEDLVFDARTWLDAELTYQKTRASFIAACFKRTIALGVVAGMLGVLALIGLVVGLIIALTPLVTAWGATALVVGLLLLVVWLAVRSAGRAWRDMMQAIHEAPADDDPARDEKL